jgi:O-antigen/teichoic acid export membrane protein
MSTARQSVTLVALNWGLLPVAFLVSVLVARALGPEGVGILAVLAAASGVFTAVGSFGLEDAIIFKYKSGTAPAGALAGVLLAVVAGIVLVGLVCAAAFSGPFVALFFNGLHSEQVRASWIYLAMVTAAVDIVGSIFATTLIVDDRMPAYVLLRASLATARVALVAYLLFVAGAGITGVLLAQLALALVPAAVGLVWLTRPAAGGIRMPRALLADLLRIGRRKYAVTLLGLVPKRLDVFLIGILLSVEFNGYYAVAAAIVSLVCEVPRSTMWPLVGNATGASEGARRMVFARVIRVQLALMCITAAGLASGIGVFLAVFYGERFLPAAAAVRLLLPGAVLWAISVPAGAYYTSLGQPGRILPYAVIATSVHVALDLVLIPRIGISGVAIASSVSQLIVAVSYLALLRRDARVSLAEMLFCTREDVRLAVAAITRTGRDGAVLAASRG